MRNSDGQQKQEKVPGSQLLQPAVDPVIVHMTLIFQACMSYKVIETSTQILEKVLGGQAVTVRTRSLQAGPERSTQQAVSEVAEMRETLGCWRCQTRGVLQAKVKAATTGRR